MAKITTPAMEKFYKKQAKRKYKKQYQLKLKILITIALKKSI